jgi:mono/diheme cytochrome c family protein
MQSGRSRIPARPWFNVASGGNMQIRSRAKRAIVAIAIVAAPCVAHGADKAKPADAAQLARGNYLVRIGGCNDCHTPGYAMTDGKTPQAQWLVGDRLGWRGPWGTTYPANLRLYMQGLTEAQWLTTAKSLKTRPPMPWFSVQQMSDADLRAIYAFVRSLGPAGQPAPAYVPPDKEPPQPFVLFPAPPK